MADIQKKVSSKLSFKIRFRIELFLRTDSKKFPKETLAIGEINPNLALITRIHNYFKL